MLQVFLFLLPGAVGSGIPFTCRELLAICIEKLISGTLNDFDKWTMEWVEVYQLWFLGQLMILIGHTYVCEFQRYSLGLLNEYWCVVPFQLTARVNLHNKVNDPYHERSLDDLSTQQCLGMYSALTFKS